MPIRLSVIDDLTRPDHTFIGAGDYCLYLGDYSARAGYAFSEINDLIQNLKKPMDRRDRPEWKWKRKAIGLFAEMLREAVPRELLEDFTFVPVPPSNKKGDANYDDRLLQILQRIGADQTLDIRELVLMKENIEPAHLRDSKRNVAVLSSSMQLDQSLITPAPKAICIFDDVLTTGAHFKAVEGIVRNQFAAIPVVGLFLARRVPEATPI